MSRYKVTAAYVTCKINDTPTGKPTMYGFYAGAVLPDSADPDNVAMLERKGMVEAVAEAPAVDLVIAGGAQDHTAEDVAKPDTKAEPEPKPERRATAKA